MTLLGIMVSLYNVKLIMLDQIKTISISAYLQPVIIFALISSILTFIMGYRRVTIEDSSNFLKCLFNGMGYDIYVEDCSNYTKVNLPMLLFNIITLGTIFIILGKVV